MGDDGTSADLPRWARLVQGLLFVYGIPAFLGFLLACAYSVNPSPFGFLRNYEVPPTLESTEVVVDSEGNLYWNNGMWSRIQVYGPDGAFRYGFGYGDSGNIELAIDERDRLYVASYREDHVEVYDTEGSKVADYGPIDSEEFSQAFLTMDGRVRTSPPRSRTVPPVARRGQSDSAIERGGYLFRQDVPPFVDSTGAKYLATQTALWPTLQKRTPAGDRVALVTPSFPNWLFGYPIPGFVGAIGLVFALSMGRLFE